MSMLQFSGFFFCFSKTLVYGENVEKNHNGLRKFLIENEAKVLSFSSRTEFFFINRTDGYKINNWNDFLNRAGFQCLYGVCCVCFFSSFFSSFSASFKRRREKKKEKKTSVFECLCVVCFHMCVYWTLALILLMSVVAAAAFFYLFILFCFVESTLFVYVHLGVNPSVVTLLYTNTMDTHTLRIPMHICIYIVSSIKKGRGIYSSFYRTKRNWISSVVWTHI